MHKTCPKAVVLGFIRVRDEYMSVDVCCNTVLSTEHCYTDLLILCQY